MSKKHRDFVIYTRNGVDINALVAFSRDVTTPATQEQPASTVEHLTVAYLDPTGASSGVPSGEQLRASFKVQFDVAPLTEGLANGWKEVGSDGTTSAPEAPGSGSEHWGASDWTKAGMTVDGFPVEKGSAEDVTKSEPVIAPEEFVQPDPEVIAAVNEANGTPSAADLDAVAAEHEATKATE